MDIQIIKRFLDDAHTYRYAWGMECVDTSFETLPSEFISFAENDLQSAFEHKYINALSNAKRALDCQADRLLKLFGFYELSQVKFWGFPRKIEQIQKFEILAPRVLNKINKTRNLMEHQYIKPKESEVEDFIDIVSLFIASTEHLVSKFITNVDYLNEETEEFRNRIGVNIIIDSITHSLIVKNSGSKVPVNEIEIKNTDPEYVEIFKRHLKKIEIR